MQLRQQSWRWFATAAAVLAAAGMLCAAVQNYTASRAAMVSSLRQQGIRNERVLTAMGRVPRHAFVAKAYINRAYDDVEVPAAHGEVIGAPYHIALMLETLDARPNSKVLEVGTGAGYQTAVLAEIGPRLYTVESRPAVAEAARSKLQSLGYRNVRFAAGDGLEGWSKYAPYDAIVVAIPVDRVPPPLVKQLADGGRLVLPLGRGPEQTLNLVTKNGGRLRFTPVTSIRLSAGLYGPGHP